MSLPSLAVRKPNRESEESLSSTWMRVSASERESERVV
jgi:hypothetical protein